MTFDDLMTSWTWTPIRNCPGRFRLAGVRADLVPEAILGPHVPLSEHRVEAAKDTVVVAQFTGGGLISYKRADGTCLHTLNTPEGFARKLLQLGIRLAGRDGTG
jgi:hypothetical protein